MGDVDWNDPVFNSTQFDDSMTGNSPFGNTAFTDFTNLESYADSPGLSMRRPSKAGRDAVPNAGAHLAQPLPLPGSASASAESSSQDSASDSSSRRKRKVTSESPMSDAMTEQPVKKEDSLMDIGDTKNVQHFDQAFTRPMHDLSLEHDEGMGAHFDFGSASSSPNQPRSFDPTMPLNPRMNMPTAGASSQYQHSPVCGVETSTGGLQSSLTRQQVQTINPGMFQLASRDQSPIVSSMVFNGASPNAIFSTPSSDSNDTYGGNSNWAQGMPQNPSWPTDYTNQFASPGALGGFTPSPITHGAASVAVSRGPAGAPGRSPLHIAPISTKSRVETQINIVMTLEKPPPGIEHLHLPLHTIAKSKLLAKDEVDKARTLELHTMLVCTSAMHNAQFKEKALRRAAAQSNMDIQRRAEQLREAGDEEQNDSKDVAEEDRPANGGEVRICNNCIQRERKRAGRKKLKREEEQQHWERYETERVVVFNSQEHLPFKAYDPNERDASAAAEEQNYTPPDGALQVTAAMRIACYCRHQSEKEGFRVIFTLKDIHGNVVAQQMSDSILITDDHKTHPQNFPSGAPGDVYYPSAAYAPNGLQTSYSMVGMSELPSQVHPFTSSRSTGNLQTLAYGNQQFNPHSHVHQLPASGYASQTTSATMTPTNLSRPASPTSAGQSGPNKKRKSSSFHRRVPSGLTMTPRVDTSQPPSSTIPSASLSVTSPFSPNGGNFGAQSEASYMTIPHNGTNAQYFGSGPSTPNETAHAFNFSQAQLDNMTRAQNASAYFSHPSSAVPSRASSPVLQQSRPGMAAYARQPIQTPTNSRQPPQHVYAGAGQQTAMRSAGVEEAGHPPATIVKITPAEGPSTGGTEVSIYGYNFTNGTQVQFGDQLATTVYYGPQALLATSPPSRAGGVDVTLVPPQQGNNRQYTSPPPMPSAGQRMIFTYTDTNPRLMEMALRYLSQKHNGGQMSWNRFTNDVANQYLKNNIGQAGIHPHSYGGGGRGGGNMMSTAPMEIEDMVLKVFDLVDACESSRLPGYDLAAENGDTMLSLTCALGMHRVAAALLARGANPDVRDKGGYTPLMHAAICEHARTFQLLIAKGADPTIRSLMGYAAIDLVPTAARGEFQQILQDTPRNRNPRPALHSHESTSSITSSAPSWDISSASMYDSEIGSSAVQSRRPSANVSVPAAIEGAAMPCPVAPAALAVWRDTLAAQIQQFQQSVQWNMAHFQLPALPPLPDYQDSVMLRRLGSLVPYCSAVRSRLPDEGDGVHDREGLEQRQQPQGLWDMFSAPARPNSTPPPAYNDLFPPEKTGTPVDKQHAIRTAVVDAVAEEKCAALFEHACAHGGSLSSSSRGSDVTTHLDRPDSETGAATAGVTSLWVTVSRQDLLHAYKRLRQQDATNARTIADAFDHFRDHFSHHAYRAAARLGPVSARSAPRGRHSALLTRQAK